MATIDGILEYARWLEEIAPGFIAMVILSERGEDYRDRDLVDQVACLIEIFGVAGAAQIVGGSSPAGDERGCVGSKSSGPAR